MSNQQRVLLEDGLIAHYLFDSNSQDTSGHNLHGTVLGATLTTDRFGNPESAYQFDGIDDYIEVAHNGLLSLTESLTISLWLKQPEANPARGYRLVDKITASGVDGYLFDTYDGSTGRKLRFIGGNQAAYSNTPYSLNEWHHVAVVVSKGGVSTFYLDGHPDGSGNVSSSIPINSLTLNIGTSHGSNSEFFKGVLDDIRIYNRALSEAEIKQVYQLPSSQNLVKQGKIVINADEWTLSNAGINAAPDATIFASNIAKWFVGDRAGKFHAYSTNFGLTESTLAETMQKAGHTWTTGTSITFDLPTLLTYDGIFVGGDVADNQVLIEYVKAGGNVYLMGGTGYGGSQAEAEHWNLFLNTFGLKFLGEYNVISGNQEVNHSHPVLAGVKSLYQNNGSSIVNLDPNSQTSQLILTHSSGQGLIATFEGAAVTGEQQSTIPESTVTPKVEITNISYKGTVKRTQSDEYVEITNQEKTPADVSGWKIVSGVGRNKLFTFPEGTKLDPGQSVRVYTNEIHPESGGFSFHSGVSLWKDLGDEAKLLDAKGNLVFGLAYDSKGTFTKSQPTNENSSAIFETVKAEFGIPNLKVNISTAEIEAQITPQIKVNCVDAFRKAIKSFIEDGSGELSAFAEVKEYPSAYELPDGNNDAKLISEKVRETLNNSCSIRLVAFNSQDPEDNEYSFWKDMVEGYAKIYHCNPNLHDSWIFMLSSDKFNNYNCALVDKAGIKPTVNWGFLFG